MIRRMLAHLNWIKQRQVQMITTPLQPHTIPEATGDGVIEPTEAVDGTTVVVDIPSSEAGDIVITVTQPDGTEVVVTEAVPQVERF